MKLAVLQLSDIHFRQFKRFAASRARAIVAALTAATLEWDELFIILSGDIAFSGKPAEYDIALAFLRDVVRELGSARPTITPHIFVIPGNHDCDYQAESDTRELILSSLRRHVTKLKANGESLRELLSIQNSFDEFRSKLLSQPVLDPMDRVFSSTTISLGEYQVRVNLINSALACQHRPERHGEKQTDQGNLFFPAHLFTRSAEPCTSCNYAITAMHHPLNWFESNNGIEVRTIVRRISDLVLLGHQHEDDAAAEETISNEKCLIVRAAALQDEYGGSSGFNIVIVDLVNRNERVMLHEWNGNLYVVTNQKDWIERSIHRSAPRSLLISPEWASYLNDPGTGYTHPHKKALTLSDIYVSPDVNILIGNGEPDKEILQKKKPLSSSLVRSHKLSLISGETRSGKSTVAKRLFTDLYDSVQGLYPILVDGKAFSIAHPNSEKVWRTIERAFSNQYSDDLSTAFSQMDPRHRALIIDDWHSCTLNDEGRQEVLEILAPRFDTIVLIGEDLDRMEKVSRYTEQFASRKSLAVYKILPFGHVLRADLIRRWMRLGRERTLNDEQLHRELEQSERVLDTVLGRSLLPSYPFFLLSLIQLESATKTSQHANGSFGYLYESLITMSLAGVSQNVTDLDVTYTLLGRIAHAMYSGRKDGLAPHELESIIQSYAIEYKADIDGTGIQNRLLRANILTFGEGEYYFRYNYIYYFFIARYLADCLKSPEQAAAVRSEFIKLADSIEMERESYIVLFVIYLTRDSVLIEHLLKNANATFANDKEFDGVSQVEFIQPLRKEIKDRGLYFQVNDSPEKNRDAHRRRLDELSEDGDDFVERAESDEAKAFIRAIRTIDLLGQIVRNFPGSMPGREKVAITSAVYSLGLRLISNLLCSIQTDLEPFRNFLIAGLVGEKEPSEVSEVMRRKANHLIVQLVELSVFGAIKRLSAAIGLAQLRPTFEEVKEALLNTPAVQLIDLSIKLDHFGDFPKSLALQLEEEAFRGKWFPQLMLRHLVAYHFMMRPVDRTVVSSVGKKLGIPVNVPAIVSKVAKSSAIDAKVQR